MNKNITIFLKNIEIKIKNFDFFELGNSFALYYILMFGAMPLVLFLRLPSKYVEYFIAHDISIFDANIFIYLFVGALFFILGYKFFNFQRPAEKIFQILRREWISKRTLWVFIAVFIFNFIIKAIRILGDGYSHIERSRSFTGSPFYSLIGLLDWLGPAALAIAFVYYFYLLKIGDFRYKIWRFIAWGAFVFEFSYGFFSTSRFNAIIPIIIYLIMRHYVYRRDIWRIIIIGILVIFILMPVQNFYRSPQNLFIGYSVLTDHQSQITPLGVSKYILDSSIVRISQSHIMSAVFKQNNEFLYGKNLSKFFISLGPPRFIWKNKPIISGDGNEFGRKLGILAPDDFVTSVAPNVVGDWYMNFGLPGIIFGMFLIGAIFRFIFESLINKSIPSLSGVMIYGIFWIQLIKGIEDWTAPVWAGLVKLSVILFIIHFALTNKKARNLLS